MDSYSFSSEEMDSAEAESWAEEQEDMAEDQEDMWMGEHEWEHEKHQRSERIDSATYRTQKYFHKFQSVLVPTHRVVVTVNGCVVIKKP